ncbi:hypothetical protein ARMSODRAFT_1053495 [Armillaria solidipes]|uniref:Uncharacterized protein n=1 Tax=Armillaria solidipes TaxID=1076256 RepID=A0A2H3B7K9_9AGAR|nr:hypothetical protein ARMSODRAFT_1053495 [Armillaria solidipes]
MNDACIPPEPKKVILTDVFSVVLLSVSTLPHSFKNIHKYLTSTDDVKAQTVDYFSALYHRNERPEPPKQWMDCNPRPAPGPDRWEKWMVKSDATDLANFCGVCTSSLCMNMPFMWLNSLLTPYLAQHSVLPEGQIATQPEVQGRDLTSFLTQLETWADHTKTPLYIGFDRLKPQGFYDAIMAYGLPSSIIDFDVSAQSDIPYWIKVFHGLTDTLTISGITKQGGPLSPIKCTLISSLGSHWLSDSLHHQTGHLRVATLQAFHGQPHLPDDRISIPVVMVEAMDDSAIVTTSLPTCLSSITMSEHFQSTYGGETNWPRSAAFLQNVPDPSHTT